MIMIKPKKDTVHWLFGINIKDKMEFEVPDNLVSEFKKLGYKVKEENKEEEIFKCDNCGKEFDTKQKVMAHSRFCKG